MKLQWFASEQSEPGSIPHHVREIEYPCTVVFQFEDPTSHGSPVVPAGFPSEPGDARSGTDGPGCIRFRAGWPDGDAPQPPAPDPKATFFEHSQTSKWWFSGQANFVFQAHGDFYAQYSGANSLKNYGRECDLAGADVLQRLRVQPNTMAYLDVEEAGWGGISGALGLAGFTNLDVVRNPSTRWSTVYRAADD